MLLFTNCEAHTANFQTAVLTYGPNEIRSIQKTKVQVFSDLLQTVWTEQLVNI